MRMNLVTRTQLTDDELAKANGRLRDVTHALEKSKSGHPGALRADIVATLFFSGSGSAKSTTNPEETSHRG